MIIEMLKNIWPINKLYNLSDRVYQLKSQYLELCEANEKLQKENNRFLRIRLGAPSKKIITGAEYYYEWGQIQSFYDNHLGRAGIVIMF